MCYIIKVISALLISAVLQTGTEAMVSTTPREAVTDFMEGLRDREAVVMERYMDDEYVNFIANAQGDDEVIERMNEALFSKFDYHIEQVAKKGDSAVARVTVTSVDFSGVGEAYDTAAYQYIVDNLYTEEIADKEQLDARCLDIYVQQIEKAADTDATIEIEVFIPMMDDGYYGWNIIMTDELMQSVLGNLQLPATE